MTKWWRIGAVVLLAMVLPAQAKAQLLSFGKKPQDPPPAFNSGPEPKDPEFCPDPRNLQPGAPDFCPAPGPGPQTPFVPVNEEDRTAFNDYKSPDPALRYWVKAEYLNWWMRDANLPIPIITTSATPSATNFGALGQSGTEVLFGPGHVDLGRLQGGRITTGFTLPFFLPVEVSGFWLNKNNDLASATSNGGPNSPVLARPVFLTQLNQEGVFLVGFPSNAIPGVSVAGSMSVKSSTNLWGVDSNIFFNVGSSDVLAVDVLLGYRYAELRESLQFLDTTSSLGSAPLQFNGNFVEPGGTSQVFDQFSTVNRFNGGQIGLRSGLSLWRFNFTADSKLAMGATSQRVDVLGESSVTSPLTPFVTTTKVPGGVLALSSNMGRTSGTRFSIIPELDLNLGFQVTRSLRLFAGYNILYWSSVVRPADQLNNNIDSRQAPTDQSFVSGFHGTQPPPPFNRTDFWAQGFSAGILLGW